MSAPVDLDQRLYIIRHQDGDYFLGWEGTGWETVKRFAHWTKEKAKAARLTLKDWDKNGYMDLICGFSGCKLEHVAR